MDEITFAGIEEAGQALRGAVKQTPLSRSRTFSEMAGCRLHLKLENLQATGSFKIRGAYNRIRLLTDGEKSRGVVCASAGNHAQGVACSARAMGVKSTVFMPVFTPPSKVQATRSYGAEVNLEGLTYDDAFAAASALAREDGRIYIHAFDDAEVIVGQGTIGLEIQADLPDVDVVLVPVGGGGLISGIATALKHLRPQVEIVGVEAEGAPAMVRSLERGRLEALTSMDTIADGIAVKSPGARTFAIVQKLVDRMVTVSDEETSHVLFLLAERAKLIAEPAGVVALAAALSEKAGYPGKKVAVVISGGNVDLALLTQIVDRGLVQSGMVSRIAVDVPDRPGSLNELLAILTGLRANVRSISHDRQTASVPVGHVRVTITFRTLGREQVEELTAILRQRGLTQKLLT